MLSEASCVVKDRRLCSPRRCVSLVEETDEVKKKNDNNNFCLWRFVLCTTRERKQV